MNDLIQPDIFDPIIPFIKDLEPETGKAVIHLPPDFSGDKEQILKYMPDAELCHEYRNPNIILKGTFSKEVSDYLWSRMYEYWGSTYHQQQRSMVHKFDVRFNLDMLNATDEELSDYYSRD